MKKLLFVLLVPVLVLGLMSCGGGDDAISVFNPERAVPAELQGLYLNPTQAGIQTLVSAGQVTVRDTLTSGNVTLGIEVEYHIGKYLPGTVDGKIIMGYGPNFVVDDYNYTYGDTLVRNAAVALATVPGSATTYLPNPQGLLVPPTTNSVPMYTYETVTFSGYNSIIGPEGIAPWIDFGKVYVWDPALSDEFNNAKWAKIQNVPDSYMKVSLFRLDDWKLVAELDVDMAAMMYRGMAGVDTGKIDEAASNILVEVPFTLETPLTAGLINGKINELIFYNRDITLDYFNHMIPLATNGYTGGILEYDSNAATITAIVPNQEVYTKYITNEYPSGTIPTP